MRPFSGEKIYKVVVTAMVCFVKTILVGGVVMCKKTMTLLTMLIMLNACGNDKKMSYGSSYDMCYLLFSNEMIKIRIKDLDKWLIDNESPCDCSYGSYD